MSRVVDCDGMYDVYDSPLCPLCSNPVMSYESFVIGVNEGGLALVHEFCYQNELDEDDE